MNPPHRDLVAGEWAAAPGGGPVLEDPATGAEAGPAPVTGPERLERAMAAADDAAEGWAARPAAERAELLDAVAAALEPVTGEIAALEAAATGVPIRQAVPLGVIVSGSFRLAAEQLRGGGLAASFTREDGREAEVRRLPWGPALCLVPWNAPAPMAAHKAASALAAGCPAILKPSEYAPYGAQRFAEVVGAVLADRGVPGGVFQLVHGTGETGARLTADARIRAVSFTGGAAGGRSVAAACATGIKPVQLELGGNNPLIVMPDADVGRAARAAVDLLTTLNGQWCRALGRLIVPEPLRDALLEAAGERLAALRAGPPLDEDTDLGPLVHSRHRYLVAARRDALGGRVLSTTKVPDEGSYLAPALVTDVDPGDATEEIFGPVATVHTYRTLDEAVALANGTAYGLEGYVAGTDEEAALAVARRVRAGEVKVNGSSVLSLHLFAPRPAWGASGLGEEGTAETLRFFTNPRVVGVEDGFALHSREP
ncbi:aldehyde dehydrogenase family protein [Actinomadura livida]|uniref:5-carboxymethyl-2-hydroxymuconate semialdehyde dehydrogenase n=1 Tax=Actinomadura livida TaxID=79909 RepID=A0A7W7I8Z2_9ACTN|nr:MULTISPECIES: aldehyde dehydrogenase [Actinomadura]MBB4772630.1 phenylacetaldehyde dehydrogenase [Actinomadura catellatispora]GGU11733.1 5-carboxymethyl-2-hydroxymuconate semialdehyde dehydrogenase [Actinomadura livida]